MLARCSPELDETRRACFRLFVGPAAERAGLDSMHSQSNGREKVGETGVPSPVLGDCSFDVVRVPGDAAVVRSLRVLDPADDGSGYIGRPLSLLLDALGPPVALALLTLLEGGTFEVTQVL